MANIEGVGEQLVADLFLAGWGTWADTRVSGSGPLPVWYTPPGVPAFMFLEDLSIRPVDLVRDLNSFNPPEQQLSDEDAESVGLYISEHWVSDSVRRAINSSREQNQAELNEVDLGETWQRHHFFRPRSN